MYIPQVFFNFYRNSLFALIGSTVLCTGAHADVKDAEAAMRSKDYTTAMRELRAAVRNGDAEAQFQLARFNRIYMAQLPLEKDGSLALSANGLEPQRYALTAPQLLPCGVGIGAAPRYAGEWELRVKYLKEADNLFEKSAAQGNAKAQFCMGIEKYAPLTATKQDYVQGLKLMRESAEQDYGPAEFYLAHAYLNGTGVEKDRAAHLRWLKRSAEHGFAFGEAWWGLTLTGGRGVPRDVSRAESLCRKASEDDASTLGMANYCLAVVYLSGGKLPDEIKKSILFLRIAAVHGSQEARRLLGSGYLDGFNDRNNERLLVNDPILAYIYLASIFSGALTPDDQAKLSRASTALTPVQKAEAERILRNFREGTIAPERVASY